MAKHPFTDINIKDYLSGIDASFESENIADSFLIAGNDMKELISSSLYEKLCNVLPTTDLEIWNEARECLRMAMAPLTFYHHFIWLQLRVSSNAISTLKSADETTAFKYQTDEAKENLLLRHGIFTKELIDYLEENKTVITEWNDSIQKTELDKLLIKSYRDFDKWYNTNGDAAFFIRSRVVQQEAMDEAGAFVNFDELIGVDVVDPDETLIRKLKKAVVYITISRVIYEWNNSQLPIPLRQNIAQETGSGKNSTGEDVKVKLSAKYRNLATNILRDIAIYKKAEMTEKNSPTENIIITEPNVSQTDKFYSSI